MRLLQAYWMRALLTGFLMGAAAACPAQEPPGKQDSPPPQDAKNADKPTQGKAAPAAKPAAKQAPAKPEKAEAKASQSGDKTKTTPSAGDKKKSEPTAKGQDADKQGDKTKTGQDKPEESEGPDADSFKGVESSRPTLFELGYSDWGLSGSKNKFRQYATPPQGFFLKDFRLRPQQAPAGTDFLLDVKSLGQADYSGDANLGFWYGNTRLSGLLSRNRFVDPTPSLIPDSERRVDRAIVRQQLWKDFSLSFAYRNDDLFKNYQEPTQPVLLNSRYRDVIAGGRFGNGYVSMKFLEWDFVSHPGSDRRDTLDKTTTKSMKLGYLWNVAPAVGLEGSYARTWIYQPNARAARLDTLSLDGDFSLGSGTNLDLFLHQQHAELPVVQNAFVRDQRSGALRLAHRFHGWTAQAGIRVQESERVRGDHTFVDVPRWTTLDAKLTGRMFSIARITVRGSTQTLEHAPVSVTDDTRSLYWSGRDTAQVKVDLAPSPYVTGYAQWGYKHWRNAARFTTLTNHNVTFGGDWQATQTIDFFAEYNRDIWGGRGENLDYPSLDNFVPDSEVSAFGMNWAFTPRGVLSVTYTNFATESNDNPLLLREGNTRGNFLSINAHYHFPRGYEVGLIYAPWSFRDNVVQTQNYDASVLMITGAARF